MTSSLKIVGPFTQILTLENLPLRGALQDEALVILKDAGVVMQNESILKVDNFESLKKEFSKASVENIPTPHVLLPGFIDSHTHICFAGSRANDHALKLSGKSYLEIAKAGGGILNTVQSTRKASLRQLETLLKQRIQKHIQRGITTIEVKSGYGLTFDDEIKMLTAIQNLQNKTPATLVPTCLAAHTLPLEFSSKKEYLNFIVEKLLPEVKRLQLSKRVDIFVEDQAFGFDDSLAYLKECQKLGFDITIHADQFTTSGSKLACQTNALSADHLEASSETEIKNISKSNTVATILPGASLSLGLPFAPARKLLDEGAMLAIASDWNPGSNPSGDLLQQASLLAIYEKLTASEIFAGLTFRAAKALNLNDRGVLKPNFRADMIAFPVSDYREILYHQGQIQPSQIWIAGKNLQLI